MLGKTINRIMQERLPVDLSDDSLKQQKQDILKADLTKTYIAEDSTDAEGLRTLVFRQPTGLWVFQQSENGTVVHRFEGDTEAEMYERINEYADEESRAHDATVLLAKAWMNTSRLGKIFASIQCDSAWQVLEDELNRLKLGVTIENLDRAFVNLYDKEPCPFESLIYRRDNPSPAATEETSAESESDSRTTQDKENKALDLKELRRRALFGNRVDGKVVGRVATVPSTGTIIRS